MGKRRESKKRIFVIIKYNLIYLFRIWDLRCTQMNQNVAEEEEEEGVMKKKEPKLQVNLTTIKYRL